MAQHPVAANLLMIVLLIGGLATASKTKQEIFPEFTLDIVTVSVPYPGASPEEIERGIVLAVEEELRGIDDIKKITSVSSEGSAVISAELLTSADKNKALQDIKAAVDRITSFPQEAERPIVSLASNRRSVISLMVYGDLAEQDLRALAERIREELLLRPNITYVDIVGTRPPEITIEVPQSKLREHNLTLDDISREISQTALELPAGGVKTRSGELLLRTNERRDFGSEFANIPIVYKGDGSTVRLGSVAKIIDGFRDIDLEASFFGKPAVRLIIYRVGDQTPIEVAAEVQKYVDELSPKLPQGISMSVWQDRSEIYRDRITLLLKNLAMGLILVLSILGIFLEPRLAFWVTMGIPASFSGAFLLMPLADASINMVSLFAFIITLGIVVDDAIVVGENIYELRQQDPNHVGAAVQGTREVWVPVTFAILTNIASFVPLFFMSGTMGRLFFVIPAIVVSIFAISWIESVFILPAHLAHQKPSNNPVLGQRFLRFQIHVQELLQRFIENRYLPLAHKSLHNRYTTVAIAIAVLITTLGYVAGGHLSFSFMPKVDADVVSATAVLPFGTPVAETRKIADRLYLEAEKLIAQNGGRPVVRGIFSQVGSGASGMGPIGGGAEGQGGHLAAVEVFFVPTDKRDFTASQFASLWRERTKDLHGLESLSFKYNIGPGADKPIDIELSHTDIGVLENAAEELAESLRAFRGVKDVDDGFSIGKSQLSFKLKPEARILGITVNDLAKQVRSAFYGARAFRQQRGRDEIWVMVRLPESERRTEKDVEKLMVRSKHGGEIPLLQAAEVVRGNAYTAINRRDGRRVFDVTADVDEGKANAEVVISDLKVNVMPQLLKKYPGLSFSLEGEQRDKRESLGSLWIGFALALVAIFALLAIPFGSYIQPLVVMVSIPFGIIGAIGGHIILGYELSIVSMLGIVALSGVVVNDSLVLIFHANELREKGLSAREAVEQAGARRFRPILLTSLTTFFGLAPMILETSVQARYLVPMAISLGFGVLFATVIALLLVPALYLVVEDLRRVLPARSGS
jgi:multidrug efflux pump subunit AcrB